MIMAGQLKVRTSWTEEARGIGCVVAGLDDDSPWMRCGLSMPHDSQDELSLLKLTRWKRNALMAGAWLTMPLAVFTIHGWVGLLVHGLALSGAAGLLQRETIRTRIRMRADEAEGGCASVKEKS
jgi:hypothetical protein